MRVSIITATYNSSETIVDTLKSLEQQSYPDIEYIIIDGASKDNTLEVVRQNCTRVSKIISEPDKGIYDALNKGIQAATGDVIGFLHSDDLFAYPDAVADIVATLEKNQSQAAYADLAYVSKDDTDKMVRLWTSGDYQRNKMLSGWMPPHPTFYMKRELYQSLGQFDLGFKIAADYDSLLRYLWSNKVSMSYLPKVLIKMRVGGASNRSLGNIYKKTCEDIQALKNNNVFWPKAILIKNFSKIPQFFRR
ncbi:TPA: glycosyltransferase [Vibrio parahaemolyticus]|uniref:glycosyltransferase family 2 protein n=1 Tax=Vibrio parahaemolyticus TaxID=670 RepID=UPI00111F2968|nr:glycosyltransferase family 2 protein [Vibrio parahaemolyticus]MDF4719600.1 glycosyltransferase family 2 protein [Vibrio parahaemolyticus]TOB27675.1 glycosyl transferase [Vibrio parahaemolyticus]HCE2428323.1 glycosyltransferase [Vibrio parahaemolyticus]HCE2485760.1 glycosyltransferase [Vibrio parahaemolyticus]HCE3563222.1 glycosyltransferase [Vibrio parahaemolyticus]